MSTFDLNPDDFPSFAQSVRAKWAPILLEPIAGSYERFVIAVAVVNSTSFHVEAANATDKLRCFYGDDAVGVAYAIELAVEHLETDLARRAHEAISKPEPLISGVQVGELREGEGPTLEAIGVSWMQVLSSLYISRNLSLEPKLGANVVSLDTAKERTGDRLPLLVKDYVQAKRHRLVDFFSSSIQDGKQRKRRNSDVIIDFSGSKLVANFGTLNAGRVGRSSDAIKNRLWDLRIDRDRSPGGVFKRQHEMLVQRPKDDDPQVTEKQIADVKEALAELEDQADIEEMRLVALTSVEEIGERVIRLEAAA